MRITQFFLVCSYILLLNSCNKQNKTGKVDYVLFSGKISNTTEHELSVVDSNNDFNVLIPINEDGTFSDTLKIESKGSYSFIIGNEHSYMFLDQGDQLELSIDTNKFDESITYTGTAADVNNYLAKKVLLQESFLSNGPKSYETLFSKEATEFKNEVSKQKYAKNELLKKYPNLDPQFVTDQTKENHYEYLSMLNDFKETHTYYTKKSAYDTPKGFLDELKDFDIDNANDFKTSQAYQELIISIFNKLSSEKASKDSIPLSKVLKESLSNIKSKNIKDALIKELTTQISPRNENVAELYSMIIEVSDDNEMKDELTQKFEKIKRLFKGNKSPLFSNYKNYSGGTTSLNELLGKYVYIDVWATWCAPCKAEIPYLKKIEEEFRHKNIEFVSISIDEQAKYDTWKNMVSEKELKGVQLFADDNWSSKFVTDYIIQGIPRFILIDPDGNIVTASAPRPSDSKLLDLFKELHI
ncbi:TlpA family protein disulfide reductase [Aquimarina longa]|uniref:TlpA family protein disulfide reductase n=1 Tax=Aquimarina longa TaxID=1080221 RepID=UPI00130D8B40|nr:TlpA disulfide reductase family protein [Aquimarina longa]